jgi:hypothetical protein
MFKRLIAQQHAGWAPKPHILHTNLQVAVHHVHLVAVLHHHQQRAHEVRRVPLAVVALGGDVLKQLAAGAELLGGRGEGGVCFAACACVHVLLQTAGKEQSRKSQQSSRQQPAVQQPASNPQQPPHHHDVYVRRVLVRALEGHDVRVAAEVVHHLDLAPHVLDVLGVDQPGVRVCGGDGDGGREMERV